MKALELDPANVEARTMLAINRWFYDYDYPAAEKEFRRALEANPNSLDLHNLRGTMLCSLPGESAEGLVDVDRAIALDPLAPWPSWTRELCLTAARRYDEVIAQHQKTLELDPEFFYLDSWAGVAYRETGRLAESAAEYRARAHDQRQPARGPGDHLHTDGQNRGGARDPPECAAALHDPVCVTGPDSLIHAHLGEMDRADDLDGKGLRRAVGVPRHGVWDGQLRSAPARPAVHRADRQDQDWEIGRLGFARVPAGGWRLRLELAMRPAARVKLPRRTISDSALRPSCIPQ